MAQITYSADMNLEASDAWKYGTKEGKAAQELEACLVLGFFKGTPKAIMDGCWAAYAKAKEADEMPRTGDIWIAASYDVRAYALKNWL